VKLIAPEAVRPFVKKGKKNDAADAAALFEAASQPDMKFVPMKTTEQQAILALHSARSQSARSLSQQRVRVGGDGGEGL
jgi:error-prone DNA polymerase